MDGCVDEDHDVDDDRDVDDDDDTMSFKVTASGLLLLDGVVHDDDAVVETVTE